MAAMVEEKEALLRELRHRIKNNLATVTELVWPQSREARQPETVEQLGKIGQRIEALRLVHERLDARDVGERAALRPFPEELMVDAVDFHEAARRGIAIEVRVKDHDVEADLAIPVGLLVNEFVTNSFEHAFGERGGRADRGGSVGRGGGAAPRDGR
jgi:two-component sensor histidine kinase